MAGASSYRIEDEPRPGGLEHLAVGPVWPFFSLMFAGSWLEITPEMPEALVVKGHILLRRGQVDEAREHAIWALRQDPSDHSALVLLASVKARRNPFLGAWWRFNTWLGSLGQGRWLLVLLGGYVAYSVGTIAARQQGNQGLAGLLTMAWLGLCIYSWVGPGLFQRSLAKDLQDVRLDRDF
jgi:hypothetical protein